MSELEASGTIFLVSGCASLDDVVSAFRRHASLGSLFVPTPTPIKMATRGRFAIALRDGGIVIEGDGEVISETSAGMTVRFANLDADSAAVLHHLERVRFAARMPALPPNLVIRVGPSGLTPPIGDDMAVCAVVVSASVQMDALPPASTARASRPSLPGMPPPAPPSVMAVGSSPLPPDLRTHRVTAIDEHTILVRAAPSRIPHVAIVVALGVVGVALAAIAALWISDDDAPVQARAPQPPPPTVPTPVAVVEPAPLPTPTSSGCRATVASTPAGADIVVGGKIVGRTPATFQLACTPTTVTLKRPRYVATSATIVPTEDGGAVKLTLERPTFVLKVSSSPSGAAVSVGSRKAGRTPTSVPVPGYEPLVVKLSKPGYAPETHRVFVKHNKTAVRYALKKKR